VSRKQRLVIVLLGIADCLVLGGLIVAAVVTLRSTAGRGTIAAPNGPTPSVTASPALLLPTWTPTPSPSPAPIATRFPTSTSLPTWTPVSFPTRTPTPAPTPEPYLLVNGDFEDILDDLVPGWEVAAFVNWEPGDDFDAEDSYARPEFRPADDSRRAISGSTLQIQTFQWVKFTVTLYQTVEAEPGARVQFEASAGGYSGGAGILMRAGIDPRGGAACEDGLWQETQVVGQADGIVTLRSPAAAVGPEGRVTVCLFAEPQYAMIHNAAFFDDAVLQVLSSGE
jgi:hypothetical protein